jgi:coproporphyrinogen III oxidase
MPHSLITERHGLNNKYRNKNMLNDNKNTIGSTDTSVNDKFLDDMLELAFDVQKQVCEETSRIDGTEFTSFDSEGEGEGGRYQSRFRVALLQNSRLFEKASFVVSNNWGRFSRATEQMAREGVAAKEYEFHATGFSMVFHPKHPKIPSTRIHYHMMQREDGYYWFSGGGDLTPYFIYHEDCEHFHRVHKEPCDKILGEGWYQRMKNASDNYFNVKHRGHIRGIGGTFFDDLNESGFGKDRQPTKLTKEQIFEFVKASCGIINNAYNSLVDKRQHESFTEENVRFMKLLRGHYTEFDLIYDRGIHFGLQSGMPVDIPLMALPDSCWEYQWEKNYPPGTEEYKTLEILGVAQNWCS